MNHRAFGLYRGTVTDTMDPLGMMRIKVRVAELIGEAEAWALPCVPPGTSSVPQLGTVVWIGFEAGDPSHPVWMGTLGAAESERRRER
jgi:hypothetical protein